MARVLRLTGDRGAEGKRGTPYIVTGAPNVHGYEQYLSTHHLTTRMRNKETCKTSIFTMAAI
jgi:hypothetical protein